jgi:hydroxymethylglutaryl-CoA synthase
MDHVYDFYKADLTSEYPIVDGHYSVKCYTRALDKCYQYYNKKFQKVDGPNGLPNGNGTLHGVHTETRGIDRFAHIAFHAPTCKLVQKSYARLLYNDYLKNKSDEQFKHLDESVTSLDYEASLTDKNVEKVFMALSKEKFKERIYPSTLAARLVGNMYTASVYSSLASIMTEIPAGKLLGSRIGVFSYGGGLASSFFSLKVVGDVSGITKRLDLKNILEHRNKVKPEAHDQVSLRILMLM